MTHSILKIVDLSISFTTRAGILRAVNDISFSLKKRETLGIAGESGSGKTQLVLSIMGLLARNGQVSGSIFFNDQDLTLLSNKQLNEIRGNKIGMIFQDSMTSLNPYLPISTQMTEVLMYHKNMSYSDALSESIRMLDLVQIRDAKNRIRMYPHEFSGGMRQRVMIAMSLLCKPDLLIADEPTTALDVTVQSQIINLFDEIKRALDTSIIFITHNLAIMAGICDKVMIMYAGNIMEYGSVDDIFYDPRNPYTQGLLKSIPKITDSDSVELATIPGNPPSLLNLPTGCVFRDRCSYAFDKCIVSPPILSLKNERLSACHLENPK